MQWYHYTLLALAILIIIYFTMSYGFYEKIFVKYKNKKKPLVNQESDFYKESYDWFLNIPKDDVYIHSYDGLKLHGFYIPSIDKTTDNLAIVIHGYQSCATDMIIIAKLYSDLGFKVLMIDLRGHGLSEGKFTSMGYYEKYDLKKWINHCLRTYGANSKILLHGVSMGAAMSMLVTEFKEKEHLNFLILDSGFTVFSKTLAESIKSKFFLIFIPGISFFTFILHKFTLNKISPLKAIKNSQIPFLIIHGDKDKPVPEKMAKELYEASPVQNKDILIIEGSPHAKAFEVDKEKVTNAIIANICEPFKIKKSNVKYCTDKKTADRW
ncbi:MAG: alpha/beta hydrolase [Candidatus Izemoplasmatales bacterium]